MPDLREAIKLGLAKCRVHDDDIDWMANIIADEIGKQFDGYIVVPKSHYQILRDTASGFLDIALEALEKHGKEVPSDAESTKP